MTDNELRDRLATEQSARKQDARYRQALRQLRRMVMSIQGGDAPEEIVEAIRPEGSGLIVRTASEGATRQELESDLEYLTRVWENIQATYDGRPAPTMLHTDLDLRFRTVRDLMGQNLAGELS